MFNKINRLLCTNDDKSGRTSIGRQLPRNLKQKVPNDETPKGCGAGEWTKGELQWAK